ncbi:hypothetical protein F5148DRAFT_745624 [Russula earlei]|uniref:Uncharacterized protein n=1 Tax=Russula earlei TaxID=71964 RepID=A0ACC0UDC4_9AGAM|nr:hypothetical protein F5148DRAFT_745624 [Russula earlei]
MHFGYVPRDIFRAVLSDSHHIYRQNMAAIDHSPEKLDAMLREVAHGSGLLRNHPIHCAIVINSRHKIGDELEWNVDFRSIWMAKAAVLKFQDYKEEQVFELMSRLGPIPQGATLASWLFEAYVHRRIAAGINGCALRKMTFCANPPKFVFQSPGSSESSSRPFGRRSNKEFRDFPKTFSPNVTTDPLLPTSLSSMRSLSRMTITTQPQCMFRVFQMTTSRSMGVCRRATATPWFSRSSTPFAHSPRTPKRSSIASHRHAAKFSLTRLITTAEEAKMEGAVSSSTKIDNKFQPGIKSRFTTSLSVLKTFRARMRSTNGYYQRVGIKIMAETGICWRFPSKFVSRSPCFALAMPSHTMMASFMLLQSSGCES